jgi:integrase
MIMKKLHANQIASLTPGDYTDSALNGLTLRVGAKRRTWVLRYYEGGTQKRQTLGHWLGVNMTADSGHLGLVEARDKARELIRRVDAGVSVAKTAPKVEHPKDQLTLAKLIDKYEKARIRRGDKVKSLPEAMRVLRNNLGDHLKLPAKHFGSAQLRAVRDEIDARAPSLANAFLRYIGPVLRWAESEEHIDASPARKVTKLTPAVKRDRVLTDAELRAIWTACETFDGGGDSGKQFAKLVRFLLATAQRKMEAGNLRYGSIIDGIWRQAPEENKSAREHLIRLPALALQQVGKGKPDELVFGHQGRVLQNFDRILKLLHKASNTANWSLHDLRRTASTRMQEAGVPPHIIDAVLNHQLQGVAGNYMHSSMDRLKSDALKQWNSQLAVILKGATVIPMRRGKNKSVETR